MDTKNTTIFYVTRDAERGLGKKQVQGEYEIITNKPGGLLDTWELLGLPEVAQRIQAVKNPAIVVFKNTKKIEAICAARGWRLLNPNAELASRVEEKISQVAWLDNLAEFLPETEITVGRELGWHNEPYIVQFNYAHTGSGTILIESEAGAKKIAIDFPDRPVRVTRFVDGPVFTMNAVVTGGCATKNAQQTNTKHVLHGNISYQITGLSPFTDNCFATVGNDWGLAHALLKPTQKTQFEKLVTQIGEKLYEDGWRGLFGADVILEKNTGRLFLLEINARQPASTTYESVSQSVADTETKNIFELHLAALLGGDIANRSIEIGSGAQVILRNQEGKKIDAKKIKKELAEIGVDLVREYANTKPGSDALRIQTTESIMEKHNEFNELGKRIATICK